MSDLDPDPDATRAPSPSAAVELRDGDAREAVTQPGSDEVAAPPRDRGRYQILHEHGRGGLGRVSRARDRELGRDVAIKELISRGVVSEVRFLREALITARLEHPGIVPVHEAGRWPDGTPFYAMKLVAGRPLRSLIAERTTVEQRILLLHHVIAVADAIAYAHGRGIIHRDLKPANVIVGEFGETVVIDWGLAKDLSAGGEAAVAGVASAVSRDDELTSAGSVLGTPAYMAPEQERGEAVDQRADVYAIGAMLWELCSLHKVPPKDAVQRRRLLRKAGIDHDLVAIIEKAIDPDPQRRYPDAGALAADLKAFKSGARITGRRYSPAAMLAHWIRRHRALALVALAFLVLAGLLVRGALRTQLAEQIAALSVTQASVEQGRQALLHGESAEALRELSRAYRRGDHSRGVAFMLARALQSRLSETARLPSASGRMWSAVFSPDGRQVVTTDDTCARIWDAQTGALQRTLPHGSEVYQAIYSPDGARLITAAFDAVRIWDVARGTLVRALTGPRRDGKAPDYSTAALSHDGRLVAAIDEPGELTQVWDTGTGATVAALHSVGLEFSSLAFSADDRWLATSGGAEAHVFDTATWRDVVALPITRVATLSFDPRGARLATGTSDGDAAVWEIPSGARALHLRELGEPIDRIAFSPDGALIATAARDGAEQVWNARSGALQSQLNVHHSKVLAIEIDPSSSRLLAAGSDGSVVVSDVAQGMVITVLQGPQNVVRAAHFDPSSRRIVGASWDGTARLWDATSPYLRWGSPTVGAFCGRIMSLEPDQRFVAVGCTGGPTRVWDTAHDQLLAELPGASAAGGELGFAFPAVSAAGDRVAIARGNSVVVYGLPGGRPLRTISHAAEVTSIAFAAAGHDLVSGSVDGAVLVTRGDGAPTALPGAPAAIDAVAFVSEGRVVAADARGHLRIYDLQRAALAAELVAPDRVGLLRPSPDGRSLLTVPSFAKAGQPVLWDVVHARRAAVLDGHVGDVRSARFVREGREILTAGSDGTARLWDAPTGRLLHTYGGSSRFLSDATLDPEGWMVVAAGGDGVIRFWDAATERPLWTFAAHTPHAIAVHFEGHDLVTRGFNGDVSRWALPAAEELLSKLPGIAAEGAERSR